MTRLFHDGIYVRSARELPVGEHWAIIEFSSISVPGDERSRQAPGHGYPAHVEETVNYIAFLNREDFEAEVKTRLEHHQFAREFRAIHVEATIDTKPTFTLEEKR